MISLLILFSFSIGERLEYDAKFAFLNLGRMTLEIKDTLTYKGVPCYALSSIVTSNPRLRFLFSLNDTIEVYARQEDLLPLLYEEKINEGSYHKHALLVFDRDSLEVTYDDSLVFKIREDTRDLLTFWYYLRTIPLVIGDTVIVHIHKSQENYDVRCAVRKKETTTTGAGEFNTIVVSAQTDKEGIFGSKGGMDIWYSDDYVRYPVQIKAAMKFGSVLFKLKGVHH
jgi:hypothetical protein